MKQPQTIALAAILAVAVGMVGLNGVQGDLFTVNSASSTNGAVGMIGHIIVTHFDQDGNVLSYQQMDNTVTFTGKNCAAVLIFGVGAQTCSSPAAFAHIALSNSTVTAFDEDTTLSDECDSTCGTGLGARDGTGITVTSSTAGIDGTNPIVKISATFEKTSSGDTTMFSAGLFDTSGFETGNMFAAKDFLASVTIAQDESLQVDWLITLAAPFS